MFNQKFDMFPWIEQSIRAGLLCPGDPESLIYVTGTEVHQG